MIWEWRIWNGKKENTFQTSQCPLLPYMPIQNFDQSELELQLEHTALYKRMLWSISAQQTTGRVEHKNDVMGIQWWATAIDTSPLDRQVCDRSGAFNPLRWIFPLSKPVYYSLKRVEIFRRFRACEYTFYKYYGNLRIFICLVDDLEQ